VEADFVLHPLIATPLVFAQAQDVKKKKSGAEAPRCCWEMQSLNQKDAPSHQNLDLRQHGGHVFANMTCCRKN